MKVGSPVLSLVPREATLHSFNFLMLKPYHCQNDNPIVVV